SVLHRIRALEVEASARQERVEPAWMNAVTTGLNGLSDALLHDRAHRRVAHVDPAFVGIVRQDISEAARRKRGGVVAKGFPRARAEVAENEPSRGVQRAHHG